MAKRGSLTSAKSLHELKQDRGSIDDIDKNKSKDYDCGGGDDTITPQIDATSSKSIGLRPSKSDTSITDSFVVVDKEYNKKSGQHSLRTGKMFVWFDIYCCCCLLMMISLVGFKWQRQLVFRSKLTMHTAYDRKDNAEPASITALAVSKDHKTLYVGDARGRVFSWSVTEQPGRGMADHWLKDEGADQCVGCHVK